MRHAKRVRDIKEEMGRARDLEEAQMRIGETYEEESVRSTSTEEAKAVPRQSDNLPIPNFVPARATLPTSIQPARPPHPSRPWHDPRDV